MINMTEKSFTYVVQGTLQSGDIVYYTGKTGTGWISPNISDAKVYTSYKLALSKNRELNKKRSYHNIYFILITPDNLNPSQRPVPHLPDLSGAKYPESYLLGAIGGVIKYYQGTPAQKIKKIKGMLNEYYSDVAYKGQEVPESFKFNPPVVIYDNLVEIRAQKKRGNFKGEYFKHTFKPGSKVYGLSNGDLLISKR